MRLLVFSRWGEMVGEINNPESASWRARINNEDTLTFDAPYVLSKGDRIVWQYHNQWHEHVVNEISQTHDGGQICSYVCDHSLQWDLRLAHVRYANWINVTASYALGELLKLTSWQVGIVEGEGTASFEFEHKNVYECILEVCGAFGLEFMSTLSIAKSGVTNRAVSLVKQRGQPTNIRFDYAFGLDGVTKDVLADDVITACYGYGKSLSSGPNSNLSFASINGGVPYVADEDALRYWGIPDGNGGVMHSFGYYENNECDNAYQLLEETRAYLSQHSTPSVSYKTDIPYAVLQGVDLGDTIQVVDTDFSPPIRIEARIGAVEENLIDGLTTSTEFGAVESLVPDIFARAFTQVNNAVSLASIAASDAGNASAAIKSMQTSITTGQLTLKDGSIQGTLLVKPDGLYFNDKKIGG